MGIIAFILFGLSAIINSRCQNGFGAEFNARRKQLKIPVVHPDWRVYKHDDYTTWEKAKVEKGHGFKMATYDGCELNFEEDHYWFSSKKLQDTVLTMDYWYKNSRRKIDSTIFTFLQGNNEDTITRQKADSILAANKINRDY
ncbi:MAG TPA: hypothetical protein VFE53_03330 [Mucilaginibacter sp.]|jgi:hypothetical protein|nr:hypothetical protein [Mucilaginibacter sp.]